MRIKVLSGVVVAAATAVGAAAWALPASAASNASSASSTSTPGASSVTCDADGHWPAYVQGAADAFDAHDDGVYLWHNPTGGWGLRVSHPTLPGAANKVVFTGTITSKGTIGNVVPVKDEKDDKIKVGKNGRTLAFRFVNYGGVDGVNFTTGCTPGLRVSFKADRQEVQPQFVHLGDKKVNPASDPFRIRRRDSDTTTAPVAGRSATPRSQGNGHAAS